MLSLGKIKVHARSLWTPCWKHPDLTCERKLDQSRRGWRTFRAAPEPPHTRNQHLWRCSLPLTERDVPPCGCRIDNQAPLGQKNIDVTEVTGSRPIKFMHSFRFPAKNGKAI